MLVEVYPVLAYLASNYDCLFDLLNAGPAVDELYNLQNWKFKLNFVLFFKSFPFFPVLQPFSKQFDFVGVCVLVV